MTMTEPAPALPKGATYKSEPCTACGCQAVGRVTGHYGEEKAQGRPLTRGEEKVVWDGPAPDENCTCHCHAAYRMVYGLPFPSQESD